LLYDSQRNPEISPKDQQRPYTEGWNKDLIPKVGNDHDIDNMSWLW